MRSFLKSTGFGASVIMLVVLGLACSTPPKPKELVDFEAMRNDRYTKRVKELKDTGTPLKASEDFYTLAIEAYDDGDMEKVKEYSLLGTMSYRNAKAIAKVKDAKERLSAANDKYLKYQKIRNDLNESTGQINETVTALELALSNKAAAAEAVHARDLQQAAHSKELAAKQLKADAEKALKESEIKLAEAEGLKADKHAAREYGMGKNRLKSAKAFFEKGKYEESIKEATGAGEYLVKAAQIAKPKFSKEEEIVKFEKLDKELFEKAHNRFRDLVAIDGRGTVVTVPSLFKNRKSAILEERYYDLDFVADLAKKYPDYKLMIVGFTNSRGNATKNITLSQARAEAARDYMLQRGVKADRIQTSGRGGDSKFGSRGKTRFKNDRVEIIFLKR